jgi:hypothetical protein
MLSDAEVDRHLSLAFLLLQATWTALFLSCALQGLSADWAAGTQTPAIDVRGHHAALTLHRIRAAAAEPGTNFKSVTHRTPLRRDLLHHS